MLSRKTLLALAAALLAAIGWFALQESEAPDDPLLSGSAAPTDGADVGAAELQGLVVDEARIAAGGDDDPGATEASPAPAAHDGLLTGIVLSETSGAPRLAGTVPVLLQVKWKKEVIELEIDSWDEFRVGELRHELFSFTQILPERQKLIFKGANFKEDD